LRTVAEYGCYVTRTHLLRETVNSILKSDELSIAERPDRQSHSTFAVLSYVGKLVTAVDVRNAHRIGAKLSISSTSLITPLARDLAMQRSVVLECTNDGSSR